MTIKKIQLIIVAIFLAAATSIFAQEEITGLKVIENVYK